MLLFKLLLEENDIVKDFINKYKFCYNQYFKV